ncbi:hypothetical protein SDC9_144714 [bioreactor metagenome]|uniref:Uncharacterized protein n=1 Tax=bioreactor metagenome TaxID=1076179 RepID=A0A645E6W1_9ZZZZ
MQIPVPEILPLRFGGNIFWGIFCTKCGIEIFHPIQTKEIQPENFKEIIKEKQKRHENHIGDLQLQQAVHRFFHIATGSQPAQRIKQRNIHQQRQNPQFCRDIKLTGPENGVDENNGNGRHSFCKINIEIPFHSFIFSNI